MSDYSNPSLLHLQSLFIGTNDSHAQAGAHIRAMHHPLLTLPVAPFILERAHFTEQSFANLNTRNNAVFHDQNGNVRIPPFRMDLTDEITISVPSGSSNLAIWADVIMDPNGDKG